jgi:aminobenzoyl-glutamate utilization protein B
MPQGARVHYALIDAGGVAPNVVQAKAKVRYLVRAAELPELNPLIERVRKIAEGAALMTETKVESRVISAVSNLLGNTPLEKLMYDNFMRLGPPDFDEADKKLAAKFQATLTKDDIAAAHTRHGLAVEPGKVLCDKIVPIENTGNGGVGSTDVGDVSWVVPTVQARGATCAIGTPFHTWQVTAQGKTSYAHKGLVHVAKVMAGTAIDAIKDASIIEEAKADFARRTEATPYVCPLPPDIGPALDMNR